MKMIPPRFVAMIAAIGVFGSGVAAFAGIEVQDLATVGIVAPKTVNLTKNDPRRTKPVMVVIQNRSPHKETIANADMLADLVTLEIDSLGACPDRTAKLVVPKAFPITLRPKQKLAIVFKVVFDCANDPAAGGHRDFQHTATVHHEALDGKTDTHPEDDVCPHDALPGNIDPNPDGTIIDKGCGAKKPDGTRGGPVLTDVVIVSHGGNLPPLLEPIFDRKISVGDTLSLQLVATDLNRDPLSYSALPVPLPEHASLDGATGLFTFTPSIEQVGKYALKFRVSDGALSDAQKVEIKVRPVPATGRTALSGRILDTNSFVRGLKVPVVGAKVSLLGSNVSAKSDKKGNFMLTDVPAGHQVFDINTATAKPAPDGSPYAGFREELTLVANINNVKSRPFFLPRIAMESLTTINPNATTQVTNPTLGVGLTIPPHTAKNADGSDFTGQLSISLVPEALAPAALPPEFDPGMAVTIQPVGVSFQTPVAISFPNIDNLSPGSEVDIWSLDAGTGRFVEVGIGRVSVDGSRIDTISGGVRNADWHFGLPPAADPKPPVQRPPKKKDPPKGCRINASSDLTLADGSLATSFFLPPYVSLGESRTLTFVYDTQRAAPQPIIPTDLTIPVRAAVPPRVSYALSVGGIAQGAETFVDTHGLNENIAETIRVASAFDASMFATGAYDFSVTLTNNYAASRISSFDRDQIVVVNDRQSPFGAGWNIAGLQRVIENANGTALLVDGDGSHVLFEGGRQDLLVASNGNNRVLRYNATSGAFVGEFVTNGSGGLAGPIAMVFGPDRNLYVASFGTHSVLRYDGLTGAFIDAFVPADSGGLGFPAALTFGPDGNLYVGQGGPGNTGGGGNVLRYNGTTGAFIDIFADAVAASGQPLVNSIAFGPDGHLYVEANGRFIGATSRILRFNGATGAFMDTFVPAGDFSDTETFTFGPDENIYATGVGSTVIRFDGASGARLGTFATAAGLRGYGPGFGPDANLYVPSLFSHEVYRFNGATGALIDTFVTAGRGGLMFPVGVAFLPAPVPGQRQIFASPAGDFSTLVKNANGNFTRRLEDGTTFSFNNAGRETAVTDRNGNTTTYSYDAAGQLISITDPVGLVTTLKYTGNRLSKVTDPAQRISRFTYDGSGNLTVVTLPDDTTRSFAYDARHLMVGETDPNGMTAQREFEAFGRFKKTTLADGTVRRATNAQAVGLVDPASGLGTAANPAPVKRPADSVSTFVDGEGHTVLAQTGAFGESTRITDAAGFVTQTPSNANGDPTMIVSPSGETVVETYDARGNQISSTATLLNGTHSAAYDSVFNLPISFTDAFGHALAITRDAKGNPTLFKSALNRSVSIQYDTHGQPTQVTDALGVVSTIAYDEAGRPVSVTQSASGADRQTTFTYSPLGFISTITDPENRVTSFTRDTAGNLTSETFPGGRFVTLGYDAAGNVTSIAPPGRTAHTFAYSPLGLLSGYTPPAVGPGDMSVTRTYNFAQQLVQTELPDGRTVAFTYDAAGRTANKSVAAGQIVFNYSPTNGNLVSLTAPDGGVLGFGYLGDRIVQQTWSGSVGGNVSVTFDKNDRISSRKVGSAAAVALQFDNDGLVTGVGALTFSRSATTGLLTDSSLGAVSDTITYDVFGDHSSYGATAGGNSLLSVQYTRDKLGRITARTETVGGQTDAYDYMYDLAGNLTEVRKNDVSTAVYAYDQNSNRLSVTVSGVTTSASYDAQDRLTDYGSTGYVFSDSGQLASRNTGGNVTEYSYDELGNLKSVDLPGGIRIDYVIDALDRRIGRKVNGTLVQGFLYQDNLHIVAELNGTNGLVSEFVYGVGANLPDYIMKGGITYRVISDHIGSPRLIVNTTDGTIAQRIDYDEFGRVILDTNPGFQPFGFAGGLYDPATGLVRFGARDYDAEIGRWTTRDPILFGGSDLNLYGYANNDPINKADIEGLVPGTKNFKKYLKDKAADFIKDRIEEAVKKALEKADGGCLTKKQREELRKEVDNLEKGLRDAIKTIDDPKGFLADKACEEAAKYLKRQGKELSRKAEETREKVQRNVDETIRKLFPF